MSKHFNRGGETSPSTLALPLGSTYYPPVCNNATFGFYLLPARRPWCVPTFGFYLLPPLLCSFCGDLCHSVFATLFLLLFRYFFATFHLHITIHLHSSVGRAACTHVLVECPRPRRRWTEASFLLYSLSPHKVEVYLLPLAHPTTTKGVGFYLLPVVFEHGEVHYCLKPRGADFTALVKVF